VLKNKVIDGIDWAKATAQQVSDYVTRKLAEIWKPIGNALEKLKQKIIGWFMKNTFFAKLGNNGTGFLNCFISIKTVSTIASFVTIFFSLLAKATTPVGWVSMVINLVCSWEYLKMGIEALSAAWKATNIPEKYNSYGKMFGYLIMAIGGKKP